MRIGLSVFIKRGKILRKGYKSLKWDITVFVIVIWQYIYILICSVDCSNFLKTFDSILNVWLNWKERTVPKNERSFKIKRRLLIKSWLIREKLTEVNLSHEEITISVLSQVTCLINILFKFETRQFLSNSLIVITSPPKLHTIVPLGIYCDYFNN